MAVENKHLFKSHNFTPPSAAQDAILRLVSDWVRVACGWKTIAPTLQLWPKL